MGTPSPHPQLRDGSWLRARYVDDEMPMHAIADLVGCSVSAVRSGLVRFQIPRRRQRTKTHRDRHGEEIRRRYLAGETGDAIAEDLGIGRGTVFNILTELGIATRGPEARRIEIDRATLVESYVEQGKSCRAIAAEHGVGVYIVERRLADLGIPRRGRTSDSVPGLSEASLRRMYVQDQRSMSSIAAELGVSSATVMNYLGRRGIPRRNSAAQKRAERGQVDAGTVLRSRTNGLGYVEIVVADGHGGSVKYAEHRYVMQQAVGRRLRVDETVHHINGDKTDNRIENLQLRQGQHGTGVVYQCLDCGSHNVKTVEIAVDD